MFELEVRAADRFETREDVRRYVASDDFATLRRAIAGTLLDVPGALHASARGDVLAVAGDLIRLAVVAAEPEGAEYQSPSSGGRYDRELRLRMLGSLAITNDEYPALIAMLNRELEALLAERPRAGDARDEDPDDEAEAA